MPPTNVRKMLERARAKLLANRAKLDAELAMCEVALRTAPRRTRGKRKKGATR